MLNSKDSLKDLVNKGILKQHLVNRIVEVLVPDYGMEGIDLLLVEDVIEAINNGELSSKTPGIGKFYWREIEHKFISNNIEEKEEDEFSVYARPVFSTTHNAKASYPAVSFIKNNRNGTIRISFLSSLTNEMGNIVNSAYIYLNKNKTIIKIVYSDEPRTDFNFGVHRAGRSASNPGYNTINTKGFLEDNPKFTASRYRATHDKTNKTIIIRAEDKL